MYVCIYIKQKRVSNYYFMLVLRVIYIFDIRYQKWKILPHLIFTSISQITTGENVWREVKLLEEGELSAISLLECTSSGEN